MGKKIMISREDLQKLFATDHEATKNALLSLFQRQTEDERTAHENIVKNSRGFCPCDVKKFTRIATGLLEGRISVSANGWHDYLTEPLPGKEYGRLAKYQRQLSEMMVEK